MHKISKFTQKMKIIQQIQNIHRIRIVIFISCDYITSITIITCYMGHAYNFFRLLLFYLHSTCAQLVLILPLFFHPEMGFLRHRPRRYDTDIYGLLKCKICYRYFYVYDVRLWPFANKLQAERKLWCEIPEEIVWNFSWASNAHTQLQFQLQYWIFTFTLWPGLYDRDDDLRGWKCITLH